MGGHRGHWGFAFLCSNASPPRSPRVSRIDRIQNGFPAVPEIRTRPEKSTARLLLCDPRDPVVSFLLALLGEEQQSRAGVGQAFCRLDVIRPLLTAKPGITTSVEKEVKCSQRRRSQDVGNQPPDSHLRLLRLGFSAGEGRWSDVQPGHIKSLLGQVMASVPVPQPNSTTRQGLMVPFFRQPRQFREKAGQCPRAVYDRRDRPGPSCPCRPDPLRRMGHHTRSQGSPFDQGLPAESPGLRQSNLSGHRPGSTAARKRRTRGPRRPSGPVDRPLGARPVGTRSIPFPAGRHSGNGPRDNCWPPPESSRRGRSRPALVASTFERPGERRRH